MQQPADIVAFLLDKGQSEFIKNPGGYEAPWGEIITQLAAEAPLGRADLFERLCETLDGQGEGAIKRTVYEALEKRFSKKREASPLTETPAARDDKKEQLSQERLFKALQEEEDGDAEVFAELYQGQIAYDHSDPVAGWHLWNGQYWEQDKLNSVINLIRTEIASQYMHTAADLTREDKQEAAKLYAKRAERLHTRRRKEHVLWATASLPGIALSGEEWDSNPWLLGTPNGVIDLQSGEFRPGQPGDWIKSVAPTRWEGIDAPAPRWEQFMNEIFDSDREIVEFMHRLLGYGITGLTTEHAFPVLWGSQGRNGKTTMLETLSYILGSDMTMPVPPDEIMHTYKGSTGPQPYIFKLRGKRLVWCAETTADRRLDAETVKRLTGGDTITAHAKYTNPIEFKPTHLLLLLTNYRPKIEAADNAIWDRVHLIPFNLRFVENPQKDNERKRDANLTRKLKEEASGILAWLIRGCLEWQATGGLQAPAKVKAATDEYRDEENTVAQFIDEYLVQSPDARITHRDVYREYTQWCKDLHLWASGSRDFGVTMKGMFQCRHTEKGTMYFGIGLPFLGSAQQMTLSEASEADETDESIVISKNRYSDKVK